MRFKLFSGARRAARRVYDLCAGALDARLQLMEGDLRKMTDKIDEVGDLVKELKGVIEAEVAQIDEKFSAYAQEVANLKAASSQEGGTGAVENSEARLDALEGDLRDMIARVKGIVADGPRPSEDSVAPAASSEDTVEASSAAETAGE